MKKLLATTLLFSLCTFCFAQDPIELNVFGSPILAYRILTGDQEIREVLNDAHKPMFLYESGVMVTVKKYTRMDLETGLVYSRKGMSFGEISFRDVDNDPVGSMKTRLNTDFLEVPFRMNYYFSEAKGNYIVAGISVDFLLKAKYKYKMEGEFVDFEQEQPSGMRKMNTGIQVAYGIRLVSSEAFGLDLEPNFKIQLLDWSTQSSTVNTHLYSLGLACKFRFKV